MPATALHCRICESEHALEAVGTCQRCFGPLDPVYDWDEVERRFTREGIAAGPSSIWRYAPLLPVDAPAEPRLAPGLTPLVPAPRLAAATATTRSLNECVGFAVSSLSHSSPRPSAAAKAQELGLQTLACSSTGNLANAVAARAAAEGLEAAVFCPVDLEPEKLLATAVYGATIYAVRGSYDHCSRLTVELSFELDWAFVNVTLRSYYAEGSKTLAYEIVEQLGWQAPDAVVCPIASGALFSKIAQGFDELRRLGLVAGTPRLFGRQAEGCPPVATAFAERRKVEPVRPATLARSLAIGNPADGDFAIAAAETSRGGIYAVAEDEIGSNMGLLAETAGVFGETAAGVTLGALREAVRRGELGASDTVVLLVTGDGLKTPGPVADRLQPVAIEPDADAVLDRLGVAV